MKKRLTAWALTGAMCLYQITPFAALTSYINVSAAETGASVQALVDGSGIGYPDVKPGDRIYVDVNVSPMTCSTFALRAKWDKSTFKLTNAAVGSSFFNGSSVPSMYVPFQNGTEEIALADYVSGNTDDVCIFAFSSPYDVSCSGEAVTLEFTVMQSAENGFSDIEVYFDDNNKPAAFGSDYSGVNISVSQSSEISTDGIVSPNVTGGTYIPTGLTGMAFKYDDGSFSQGLAEPQINPEVLEYTFEVPANESGIPNVEVSTSTGVSATVTQATDFETNNTAVIVVKNKKGAIYRVRFSKEQENLSTPPSIYPEPNESVIPRNSYIMMTGLGTIYYTVDGSDPVKGNSNTYEYTGSFTPESAGVPDGDESFTVKAVAIEDGRDPSAVVTAVYELPGTGTFLSGITVNGTPLADFNRDSVYYDYRVPYTNGTSTYTFAAEALNSSSVVTVEPETVTFNGVDGKGGEQMVKVSVGKPGTAPMTYDIHVVMPDCLHSNIKTEDTATCQSAGEEILTCMDCGKELGRTATDPTPHSFINGGPVGEKHIIIPATCETEGLETYYCETCDKVMKTVVLPSHTWSNGVCTSCGAQESETHKHNFDAEPVITPATCTTDGSRIVTCSECGEQLENEVIPATGHYFKESSVRPHCTEAQQDVVSCEVCGATKTVIIPPTGKHVEVDSPAYPRWDEDIDITAEEYEQGHWTYCGICGEKMSSEAHETTSQMTVPPTTENEGMIIHACDICGAYKYEYLPIIVPTETVVHTHDFSGEWKSNGLIHWKECSCGAKDSSASHSAGTEWEGNSTKHWHLCQVCGAPTGQGMHTSDSGKIVNGEVVYTCTVCGLEIKRVPHVHTPKDLGDVGRYMTDSTSHWQICAECGEKYNVESHTKSTKGFATTPATEDSTGIRTYSCTDCGYAMETEVIPKLEIEHYHTFNEGVYVSDDTAHWQVCTECGGETEHIEHAEDMGVVTLAATEEAEGVMTYSCSVCGHVLRTEPIPMLPPSHKHSFLHDYISDETGHWQECECGELTEVTAHTENSGVITVPATEESEGIITYSCTVCGCEIRTESIPKLTPAHTHSYSHEYQSNSAGHWKVCDCGDVSVVESHIEGEGTVTHPATEFAEGLMTYSCTVCGYIIRQESIPMLPPTHRHTFSASFSSDSFGHWNVCDCGEISTVEEHIEDTGVVTLPATEETEGIKTYSCMICGFVLRTETLPKLTPDHTHSYDYSYDKDHHWKECDCGDISEKAEHTWGTGKVVKAPTYTDEGVMLYTCTVCGEEKEALISKLEQIAATPPTETGVTSATIVSADTANDEMLFVYTDANGDTQTVSTHFVSLTVENAPGTVTQTAKAELTDGSHSEVDAVEAVFDITLRYDDMVEVQPGGEIKVTLEMPELTAASASDNYWVYHMDDNGVVTPMKNVVFDPVTKTISFKTTHFSIYILAKVNAIPDTSDEPDTPDTPVVPDTPSPLPSVPPANNTPVSESHKQGVNNASPVTKSAEPEEIGAGAGSQGESEHMQAGFGAEITIIGILSVLAAAFAVSRKKKEQK